MTTWNRSTRPAKNTQWVKRTKKHHDAQMLALGSLYAASSAEQTAPRSESPPIPMIAPGAKTDLLEELPAIRRHRGRPKGSKTDKSKKKKEKDITSERYEQRVVVAYCEKQGIPFFAIPNAARRTIWEAMEAKRSGMKSGVLDLCFPVPMQGKGGLYIEMKKREGGIVSPMQKYWIAILRFCNYRVEVARGAGDAIPIIDDYFNGWGGFSDDLKQVLSGILDRERDRKQRLLRMQELQKSV